jgi:2-desacetyl-2-hydroxyethyl bacteriochlorophyllide A dehydrogenase
MKTLVIEQPGQVGYGEKDRPVPAPGEVLLKVRRLGFCGTDLSTFRGGNPLVSYPRVPGHEVAAVIEAVTAGVPGALAPGREVTVMPYTACGRCTSCRAGRANACRDNQTLGVQRDGAFAEFIAVPWEKVVAAPLAARELALVEPLAVGFHAAARGRVARSDTVVVIGCGMIGLGAIAAAGLQRGATVIAVDLEDGKLALARRAGASAVVNSRTEPLHERLLALTGGRGPDVVIEAVGATATFQAAVEEASFAGRVVYIGYAKAPVSYETRLFVQKELDILGSRNAAPEDFQGVIGLLQGGRYPAAETVTQTVPFSAAAQALRDWAANPAAVTKIHVELS